MSFYLLSKAYHYKLYNESWRLATHDALTPSPSGPILLWSSVHLTLTGLDSMGEERSYYFGEITHIVHIISLDNYLFDNPYHFYNNPSLSRRPIPSGSQFAYIVTYVLMRFADQS
jgi:hypothetical protein